MLLLNTFALSIDAAHLSAAKEERLVDVHELFAPKLVLVQDVGSENLRGDTARQIFDSFAYESAIDSRVVAVGFCESLLEER